MPRIIQITSGLLLCLCLALPSKAQVFEDAYFRQEANRGLDLLYNQEFEQCHIVFSQLQLKYESHPGPYFLLALNRWWQSYISTTPVYHNYIETKLTKALSLNKNLKKLRNYELEYTFFQYMCYAFQTRLYILQKEWFNAAQTGRKALAFLEKGFPFMERAPEFYFSSGIYHYYAATYPERHIYVKPFMIFFPDGNAHEGLEELAKAANSQNFTQIEALYYLGDIYLQEKTFEKALEIKARLTRLYPKNVWFKVDYARTLCYVRKFSKAERILTEIRTEFEQIPFNQERQINSSQSKYTTQTMMRVYQLIGVCQLKRNLDPVLAEKWLLKSVKMAEIAGIESDGYLAATNFYLGSCYEQMDRLPEAKKAYQKVLKMDENQDFEPLASKALARIKK